MYADFGTVSFPAMSSGSEPSGTPGKSSAGAVLLQSGSPTIPTSEPLRASEIRDPEAGDRGGLPEEVAETSGAGQEGSASATTEAGEGGAGLLDVRHDGDGDDGYHTPTSPSCKIPADLPCPPAPRKVPPKPRWRKRNLGVREVFRIVRRRIHMSGGFELVVLRPVVDCAPAGAGEDDVVG